MSTSPRRAYDSRRREKAAAATRERVLRTATTLFARRGIDAVTINELAERAGVSGATVYALFKSKEGVIRALVEQVIFGSRYQAAIDRLNAEGDPVAQIRMTASVARAIYEGEAVELGLLRGASSFSVALRKMEHDLEKKRFALQEARVTKLYAAKKGNETLSIEKARVLLWITRAGTCTGCWCRRGASVLTITNSGSQERLWMPWSPPALRNIDKNLQNDVDFRQARSSSQ